MRKDCILGGRYSARRKWIRERGLIPAGLQVLHSCDEPYCKNLDHCWLGTQSENLLDASRKGRLRFDRAGDKNPNAKLTKYQVRMIRDLVRSPRNSKGYTQRKLAELFQVSKSTINAAVTGATWGKRG